MAKETKSNRGALANERRYGDVTPKQLSEGAQQLRELAASLVAISEAMEKGSVKKVWTDGATMLERGASLVATFERNVKVALIKAGKD
ncbi:MAG: hypothetical protein IT428_06190 [Planctomycetaceae bacterium]|nr:hypothetical protein [Planctomycetaceae bacterium]